MQLMISLHMLSTYLASVIFVPRRRISFELLNVEAGDVVVLSLIRIGVFSEKVLWPWIRQSTASYLCSYLHIAVITASSISALLLKAQG